jgi:flagellar hook-associated protein 3 FlgL
LRVTNNMLSQNLLRNLEAAQGRMDYIQNQMSTGHRITRPSDDPVGIENALRIKSNISHVEQWKANASEGLAYMNTTDGTLGDMTNMLQRAKELAVQGANGSMSPDDRSKIAIEIDQINEQMVQLANTKVGSKYIFGGTANHEPFPKDATQWQGSDDVMKFEVGSNLSLEISVNGKKLFGVTRNADTTDSVAMFETLEALSNALKSSDPEQIQAGISGIEDQIDNVVNYRAELGARLNRMDSLYQQLDSTSLNLTQALSNIMDADIAKTLIDFKNQENVYQAALSVGAKIIQPSLVDFMR